MRAYIFGFSQPTDNKSNYYNMKCIKYVDNIKRFLNAEQLKTFSSIAAKRFFKKSKQPACSYGLTF